MRKPDPKATARTRARYQRIAPFYNLMEILPEKRYIPWRKSLWARAKGPKILEVGVGTGKNMPYYPDDVQMTAVDLTPGMLSQARTMAEKLDIQVDLQLGDAQALDFPDNTFDTVITTFVFCSVPDPVLGFQELNRVVKPGGKILLLEHMRANYPFLGFIMDLLNPIVVRMTGANINRKTVVNAHLSGMEVETAIDLGMNGIFKQILGGKPYD